jgi:hypothetical protein
MKNIHLLISIPLLFVASPVYSWSWDRDYESCIINHIEDAKNDRAAWLLKEACRKKFPMTVQEMTQECVSEEQRKSNPDALLDCYSRLPPLP